MLDWAACAIGGLAEPGTSEPRALASREGAGPCTIIGGRPAGPQAASLANGPLGAILEMDDVDKRALLHPGPVILPAALAAAEASGCDDGNRFLDAVVRGYEAMIRVGRAAGAGHYRYFHATGTCGPFGAAAAAGSLLGLTPEGMAWALGNAGQQAAGLWQVRHEPVYTKSLHNGRAAANGVAAALLASDGYAGPRAIFEGPQGFFAALCAGADPMDVVARPDEGWAIHDVSFKPHAACRHAHAAIDVLLDLRAKAKGREPSAIEIGTYADAVTFCDRPTPVSVGQAKFSLQHAAAAVWSYGDAGLARFTMAAIAEPELNRLRGLTTVATDPEITGRYPGRFGARAKVTFGDGTSVSAATHDALGDPERPISSEALLTKAQSLMAWGGLQPSQAEALISACLGLGQTHGLSALSAALP